jgi:hypothetical protein
MLPSNSACERLENVTTTIATKDLAWRLYHSEKIVSQLQATEDAIALATRTFGVRAATYLLLITFCLDSYYSSIYRCQLDPALDTYEHNTRKARQHDEDSFSKILYEAARSNGTILVSLFTGSQGNKGRYTQSGLAQGFVKVSLHQIFL